AAQQAQVDPGGQALVQPVLAPPDAAPRGDVDVAEVDQAHRVRHGKVQSTKDKGRRRPAAAHPLLTSTLVLCTLSLVHRPFQRGVYVPCPRCSSSTRNRSSRSRRAPTCARKPARPASRSTAPSR